MFVGLIKFSRQLKTFLPLLFPAVCLLLTVGAGGFYRSGAEVHPEYVSVRQRNEVPPLTAPDPEETPRHAGVLGRRLHGTLPLLIRSGRDGGNVLLWRVENAELQQPCLLLSPDFVQGPCLGNIRNFIFLDFCRRALPVRAGPFFC